MNEFKFHVNRSFGTEQFTYSATINSDKITLDESEIKDVLTGMTQTIDTQFGEVVGREVSEKHQTAEMLSKRVEANKAVREAITKINLSAVLEKYTDDQINKAFEGLASEAEDIDTPKDNIIEAVPQGEVTA